MIYRIHIPRPIDISEIEVARTQPREHDIKITLKKIKETLDWQNKEAEVMEEFECLTDRTPVMPEFFINRANSTQRSAKKSEAYEKTDSRFWSPKKAVKQESPIIRRSAFNSTNRKQMTKSTPKIRAVLWKTTV